MEEVQQPALNLPLVPVRGVTDADIWLLYERYNLQFSPPTGVEWELCRVILALEELVNDQEGTITRLRKRE